MDQLNDVTIKINPEMANMIIDGVNIIASMSRGLGNNNTSRLMFYSQLISNQFVSALRDDEIGKQARQEALKLIDVYNKSIVDDSGTLKAENK